ncbi:MAG: hypothetical protein WBN94_04215 [Methanothrix sp.]|jgi:hypothetical protein
MKPHSGTGINVGERFARANTPVPIGGSISKQRTAGTSDQSRFRYRQIEPIYNNFRKDISRGTYSNQVVNAIHSVADAGLNAEIDAVVRDAVTWLSGQYEFREPVQVKSFLSGNNTLRRMLSTIHSKIRKEFPSEKITLEVVSDSSNYSEKDVVVSVTTSLPVDEAIERLDKVEDTRWNKDSTDPYVDICVKLEYQ